MLEAFRQRRIRLSPEKASVTKPQKTKDLLGVVNSYTPPSVATLMAHRSGIVDWQAGVRGERESY